MPRPATRRDDRLGVEDVGVDVLDAGDLVLRRAGQPDDAPALGQQGLGGVVARDAGHADDECGASMWLLLARDGRSTGATVDRGANGACYWTLRQVVINVWPTTDATAASGRRSEAGVQHGPGRVAGKGIVITGAGSGMGRAFALGLAREGASSVSWTATRTPPRRSPRAVRADGAKAVALTADVSMRAQVAAALDRSPTSWAGSTSCSTTPASTGRCTCST